MNDLWGELLAEVRAMFTTEPTIEIRTCAAVGSRVTCNPPPMDTDRDILVLVNDWRAAGEACARLGFFTSGSQIGREAQEMDFVSVKRDELNLLLTDRDEFYDLFIAASSVAKRLNVMDKMDRIALFQAVLYGAKCA